MIEKPVYKVIIQDGNYEIRFYEDFNIARVVKKKRGDYNDGFNDIFNYIGGSNEANRKISMTVPVITAVDDETISTAFVMPREFDLEKLPRPDDSSISIEKFEGGYFAAVRFSGMWTDKKFQDYKHNLRQWIDSRYWEALSEEIIARYNPPFTPPFLRHNEILIRVVMKEEN